jgi:hypothetical protein
VQTPEAVALVVAQEAERAGLEPLTKAIVAAIGLLDGIHQVAVALVQRVKMVAPMVVQVLHLRLQVLL